LRADTQESRLAWFGLITERLDGLCVATETDILLLSDDLRRLVDTSEERGSVLQSELNDVLEPLSLDALEIDLVHRELETRQIDVVNDVGEDGDTRPEPVPEPEPLQISWETTTDALQLFLREAGRHPLLTAATCAPSSG
jgi:Sigma-70 factor, region 1.1/Sigma-70 factor, region 1.2